MKTVLDALREHPFLKSMPSRYIDMLEAFANIETFESGYIFYESEEADKFYLIIEGEISLDVFSDQKGAITIQLLRDGEILGWSWMVPPYHWRFNARVAKYTTAIVLDGKQLRETCETNRDFGYELLKRLAQVVGQRLEISRIRLLKPARLEQL